MSSLLVHRERSVGDARLQVASTKAGPIGSTGRVERLPDAWAAPSRIPVSRSRRGLESIPERPHDPMSSATTDRWARLQARHDFTVPPNDTLLACRPRKGSA